MEEQVDDQSFNTLSTAQGAEKIKSLMFPETKEEVAPQPENGQVEDDSEGYEEATDEDVEYEDGEEVTEDDESEQLYTVKVDGKEKQVTLDELVKGYQLEAHYTQKSQKLAEEQKAVSEERKILQSVHTKFEQLNDVVTYLQGVNQYLESTIPAPPSIDLAKTNPAEYIQAKDAYDRAMESMGGINAYMTHVREQAKQIVSEMQAAGAKVIREKMPELLQAQNVSNLYSYLIEEYGYNPEAINKNVDPNLFIMAEKARRFDDMMKKGARPDFVKTKVHKSKPKPQMRVNKQSQQQAAMSKFKSAPTTNNAAAAIRELFG